MKKFKYLMIGCVLVYVCLASILFVGIRQGQNNGSSQFAYKVEIHQVMKALEEAETFIEPDVSGYEYLKEVSYLSEKDADNREKVEEFYKSPNQRNSSVQPLVTKDGMGYVRFDYVTNRENRNVLWFVEIVLFVAFLAIFLFLLYVRNQILKPFHTIRDMPYELSKGHLKGELQEQKNHFFGKFIWGIGMLRDTLEDSKAKELKLLKEKKLLLLSISHDIKIPLSTIRLYAKAIKEEVYDTKEKRQYAAGQIEVHTKEIENFVREIMTASSEDLIHIEVKNAEFYLRDYMEKIRETYAPKTAIHLTEFTIAEYENRLLKGDFDRAVEVMENLLENAMKYGDGKQISIDFYEEDYCQVIRVFNTGEPVPGTELPHLFDSFYRGSNAENQQGNGLGLYIARQMMHKMGGEIFAEICENGMWVCLVFQM